MKVPLKLILWQYNVFKNLHVCVDDSGILLDWVFYRGEKTIVDHTFGRNYAYSRHLVKPYQGSELQTVL